MELSKGWITSSSDEDCPAWGHFAEGEGMGLAWLVLAGSGTLWQALTCSPECIQSDGETSASMAEG